jgi:glucosyl-dolichyl phosphate glucuronosyltransferase
MRVSVIIPTLNRPQTLLRTLQSLQEQRPADFEILVMDNAAAPQVRRLVKDFNRTAQVPARYLFHPSGGDSGARNRGALEARGELLVYTDDDMTFAPGWLAAYRARFAEHPEMTAAGGCVRPIWEKRPPAWLVHYMSNATVFPILSLMEPSSSFQSEGGFFFGCNLAIWRSTFEWTGFPPGQYKYRHIGDGDWGLNRQIDKRGGRIGYVPEAIAYHHIPPHRMTAAYISRWAREGGLAMMYQQWWRQKRRSTTLARDVVRLAREYWRPWLKHCLIGHRKDPAALATRYNANIGWGKLCYIWHIFTDAKVRTALDRGISAPDLRKS